MIGEKTATYESRWRPLVEPTLLLGCVILFWGRYPITGRIVMLRDLVNIWCGYQSFYRDTLLSGAFPLWQPYSGCGEPFFADPQSACLYPFSLIFLTMPLNYAVTMGIATHLFLAGIGTYVLCRLWRISRNGSLLAGISFAFGTYMITRVEFYAAMAGISWYPLVMAVFTYWLRRPRIGTLLGVTLCMTLQLSAGYPEATLFTAASLGWYALCVGFLRLRDSRSLRTLAYPVVAVGIACALAAVFLLPQLLLTVEAQQLSQRAVVDPELGKASLNPLMLATLLFPHAYGTPGLEGRYWAPSCYEYWAGAMYIGLMPVAILATAALAWVLQRRSHGPDILAQGARRRAQASEMGATERANNSSSDVLLAARWPVLIGLAVIFILYSMGKYTPFFTVVWHIIPVVQKFRWPTKSLMCVTLALSCLAGLSLDWLAARSDRGTEPFAGWRRWTFRWGVIGAFAGLSIFAGMALMNRGEFGEKLLRSLFNLNVIRPEQLRNIEWDVLGREAVKLVIVAPLCAVLIQAFTLLPKARPCLGLLMAGVLFGDLAVSASALLPAGNASILDSTVGVKERIQSGNTITRAIKYDPVFEYPYTEYWFYGISEERVFRSARDYLVKCWSIVDHAFTLQPEISFQPRDIGAVTSIYFHEEVPPENKARLLRMVNCSHRLIAGDIMAFLHEGQIGEPRIETLPVPLPRAYVVGGVQVLEKPDNVLGMLAYGSFDPLEVAFTDMASAGKNRFYGLASGRVEHNVTRIEYGPNRLAIEVESKAPGVLIVTDTFFPGWHATVNGKEADICKVNGAFRGVIVPQGTNAVSMVYRPRKLMIGATVSCITAATCLAMAILEKLRPRAVAFVNRLGEP